MSYEYRNKRIIENFARRYTTNVSDEVDILFELEHVYSQAAKADEYEAKAKAFENVKADIMEDLRSMREKEESSPFVYEVEIETLNNILAAMDQYERMAQYESGELDE